jgi:hypothetical protein
MRWFTADRNVIEQVVAPWMRDRIGCPPFMQPFSGFGLFDDLLLRAGVLFTDYNGSTNVSMHVASDGSRRWMTRNFLSAVFLYPFEQLKVLRITGIVQAANTRALRFDRKLGFKIEGRLRRGAPDGSDVIVLGMLRSECRFLGDLHGHGQRQRAVSA